MYFGFNSLSKEFFKEKNGGSDLKLYQMFLGGAAAGFGFWGFLYPLDVIKSRMQVQSVRILFLGMRTSLLTFFAFPRTVGRE